MAPIGGGEWRQSRQWKASLVVVALASVVLTYLGSALVVVVAFGLPRWSGGIVLGQLPTLKGGHVSTSTDLEGILATPR